MNERYIPPQNPEQREQLAAEFSFVFCYHTPENAQAVAQAIADCDTVAIEFAGLPNEEARQACATSLNWLSDPANQQDLTGQSQHRQIVAQPFLLALMDAGLAGSGKRFELLDMTQEHPEFELVARALTISRVYRNRFETAPIRTMRQLAAQTEQALEAASPPRDREMAGQLVTLGRQPRKIGVVAGLSHENVEGNLTSLADAVTSSIYIRSSAYPQANTAEATDFTASEQLIHQVRLDPTNKADPELVDRRLVEHFAIYYAGVRMGDDRHDWLKQMSQEQVLDLLEKIDDIRHSVAGSLDPAAYAAARAQTSRAIDVAILDSVAGRYSRPVVVQAIAGVVALGAAIRLTDYLFDESLAA